MSTLHLNLPDSSQKHAVALAEDDGISLDQFVIAAPAKKRQRWTSRITPETAQHEEAGEV